LTFNLTSSITVSKGLAAPAHSPRPAREQRSSAGPTPTAARRPSAPARSRTASPARCPPRRC
jgi:hypothetical protein